MNVIGKKTLREYSTIHPNAEDWLANWYKVARRAQWNNIAEVRSVFAHADAVSVASGKTVTVFNVCGNKHRMITAIHYESKRIFVLMIMTHSEYSRSRWKGVL